MSSHRDRLIGLAKREGLDKVLDGMLREARDSVRSEPIAILCDSCQRIYQGPVVQAMAAHRYCSDPCRQRGPRPSVSVSQVTQSEKGQKK